MLLCKYCSRNLFKAVIVDLPASQPISSSRLFFSNARLKSNKPLRRLADDRQASQPTSTKNAPQDREITPGDGDKRRELEIELKYLQDPVKLAQRVHRLLAENNVQWALKIAQFASKDRSCTVSWNHIINHEMKQERTSSALKIYNDMKKRAQSPDAYTYTLIFKGLANNAHLGPEGAVQAALKVFDSLLNEDSPVRPSSIHVNAMLNVCAQALDIDTMFSVAARIPEKGPDALNHFAFTTILQSIHESAMRPVPNSKGQRSLERRQRAIVQGRRIWGDIIDRWSKNAIQVDERLVCAMGRLLLVGDAVDNDDVLSLVEQTMRIERRVPRIGDPNRPSRVHRAETRLRFLSAAAAGADPAIENALEDPEEKESIDVHVLNEENLLDIERTKSPEFNPLPFGQHSARLFPVPGPNTLSLVLSACSQMGAFPEGQQYWDSITQTVIPDKENYHSYLRTLRSMRAGGRAVDLVADMARTKEHGGLGVGVEPKTFRIAMSACVRNFMSTKTMREGIRLLKLMQSSLQIPDPDTMTSFLELFQKRNISWPIQDIVDAADTLFDLFRNLRGLNAFGGDLQDPQSNTLVLQDPKDSTEALDPVSKDWSDSHARAAVQGYSFSQDLVAKGHIDAEARTVLKGVGRRLEAEYTNILKLYDANLAPPEQRRILGYRYRVRDWIWRRRNRNEEGFKKRLQHDVQHRACMGSFRAREQKNVEDGQRLEEEQGRQLAIN